MPRPDIVDEWREALIVDAALQTGLLGALADAPAPEPAADLAVRAGLDPRAVRIVAGALVALGYLEGDAAGLGLSARGRALLASEPGGADPAASVGLTARAIASHLRLAETLRHGHAGDDVSAGDPATRARFMGAMRHIAGPRAPAVTAALGPPPPGATLLDIGGAPGTYARAFAAAGWAVTVFDLPDTLALGADELRAAGVATVAGDATETIPEGPWDAVYLGNIVHLFDPEGAAALLARAGAVVAPGGALAVQEVVRDLSIPGARFAVMMLLSTPLGDSYTEAEHRDWMAAAGCPLEAVVALEGGMHHLLIGRRGA